MNGAIKEEAENLKKTIQSTLTTYQWIREWKLPWKPGGSSSNEQVDLVGRPENDNHYIFIELEEVSGNDVRNVAKVWRWFEESGNTKPVLLIHIFSTRYSEGTLKTRMQECIFIGEKAEKETNNNINYRWFVPKYWPSNKNLLDKLIGEILSLIAGYAKNKV